MNPTIALSMVLLIILGLMILLSFILRIRREEVINAKAPSPDDPPADVFGKEAAAEVAAMIPAAAPKGISEEAIAEKTRLGITREQAIEIITNQAAWDAEQAKAAKAKK